MLRAAIRWALRRQLVPERMVELVMELYSGSKSRVTVAGHTSSSFEITLGVHQGSALSPLLFNLVMEKTTRECRRGDPLDMLYADDIFIAEWKMAMEKRSLNVNLQKKKNLGHRQEKRHSCREWSNPLWESVAVE